MTTLNAKVVNDNSNCSPIAAVERNIDGVDSCFDSKTIQEVAEQLNLADVLVPVEEVTVPANKLGFSEVVSGVIAVNKISRANALEKLKNAVGCGNSDGDTCIISKVPDSVMVADRIFKPEGTRNATDWLSNHNIDKVLKQYEDLSNHLKNFGKFLHLNYHMVDFMDPPPRYSYPLTGKQIYDVVLNDPEKYNCFGTVLNTDVSTGKGQHWFAMFGDFRNTAEHTIEIYNCAGGQMDIKLEEWGTKQAAHMYSKTKIPCKFINVSLGTAHQRDTYSCGIYSIYYIIKRLEKHPYLEFSKAGSINDKMIHDFRNKIFHK